MEYNELKKYYKEKQENLKEIDFSKKRTKLNYACWIINFSEQFENMEEVLKEETDNNFLKLQDRLFESLYYEYERYLTEYQKSEILKSVISIKSNMYIFNETIEDFSILYYTEDKYNVLKGMLEDYFKKNKKTASRK